MYASRSAVLMRPRDHGEMHMALMHTGKDTGIVCAKDSVQPAWRAWQLQLGRH